MNKIAGGLPMVLIAASLLAACESAPVSKAPEPAKSAPPSAPRESPPPRPQPPAPEADSEGMTVYELQDRLAALGYKPGAIDGVLGPRTLDALKKFQADKNLAVTGTLNADTIRALRTAKP